jgi:hypothetical protein
MRTFARWYKLRAAPFEVEDVFMYLALVSFAITTALYLATIPTFFNLAAITEGRMMPYASLERDLVVMLKEFFVVQFFFWLTLWAVKWSLLFMFRRLTDGINFFNKVWWAIFVFSILTFIGCCISNFTSCSSMEAWFTAGDCLTPRDARAKNISLWFSLAADLSTDLLSKIYPPSFPCPDRSLSSKMRVRLNPGSPRCFLLLCSHDYANPRALEPQIGSCREDQRWHHLRRWHFHHGYRHHPQCVPGFERQFRSGQHHLAHVGMSGPAPDHKSDMSGCHTWV